MGSRGGSHKMKEASYKTPRSMRTKEKNKLTAMLKGGCPFSALLVM